MNNKSLSSAFLSLLLLLMLLLAPCLAVPVQADLSWDIQIVSEDASFIGNGYCPIKVDSDGNPHIAYSGTPRLGYASWNGSDWNIQQRTYAFAHDLALDANGNPHITLGSLAYATWNGTGWDIQTVTTDYTVYSSLALDSLGNPHVAYISGDELKYATRNGSNWTAQTVTTDKNLPYDKVSLALDSNDTPHIMYAVETSYVDNNGVEIRSLNLKLAVWKNSQWTIEPVLASSNLINFGNMVLDSKGYPHFICSTGHFISPEIPGFLSNILYVSWDGSAWGGSAWNTHTAASNVNLVNIGFLALSPDDYPHIVYTTRSEQLVYARWTGTTWESHTVDTQRIIYKPCYLAVDSEGNPHISYLKIPPDQSYNPDTLNLMHATANVPEPAEVSPAFPLLIVSAAIIIGTVIAVIAYVWKKKTKH